MQGTLNEIDISSILQLLELGQRTGELLVEAYNSNLHTYMGNSSSHSTWQQGRFSLPNRSRQPGPYWFVFFVNGQITYAADGKNSSLLRLRDYLRRYQAEDALKNRKIDALASSNEPEYAYLWLLLEEHILTPAQGRSIIQSMVSETLFDLLSLNQGGFVFDTAPGLAPLLTTLEIKPLIAKVMKQVQQWKQFHPQLYSPDQCPIIVDDSQLRNTLKTSSYKNLTYWADGKTSVRQLSRYLNRDILTIGRAIYPYVQRGWVQFNHLNQVTSFEANQLPEGKEETHTIHVVCIDDDRTTGKTVAGFLSDQGCTATIINEPIQALSQVFELKPDLIFCDIAMPQLDGYEICAMLRQSTAFRQTPIIMLTGKDGFIDRVRARMVGATDYLTKPFGKNELLTLLEKYIGSDPLAQISHCSNNQPQ